MYQGTQKQPAATLWVFCTAYGCII